MKIPVGIIIGETYGETELSILHLLAVSLPQQLSSSNVALLVLGLLFYFTGLVVSAVVAVWIFNTCGKCPIFCFEFKMKMRETTCVWAATGSITSSCFCF